MYLRVGAASQSEVDLVRPWWNVKDCSHALELVL